MPKKSIWVVEQGTYSDYRVVGVFTSKESAELVASRLGGGYDEPSVAEWPLDPAVEELRKGYQQFLVHMNFDGTVERCEPWKSSYDIAGEIKVWHRSTAPAYVGKNVENLINATVWAKDKKHAVKIVNEKRLQMIASGEFKKAGR